ncbi:MAG: hypothetical protein ACOX7C_09235 [Brevefilum sp.]|jgi:hypothetical protein
MSDDKNVDRGELNILEYGGKILSVYRRCSCGGDVEIKKDETGLNIAKCKNCGAYLEWRDGDTIKQD